MTLFVVMVVSVLVVVSVVIVVPVVVVVTQTWWSPPMVLSWSKWTVIE